MNILVTGGAGFLGSNLCERLLAQGHQVYALDNLYTGRTDNIENLIRNPKFKFLNQDVRKEIDLDVDQIYHLACPASPPHYQKDPIFTLETSIFGAKIVLELAKKCQARVLLASTSEIYGDPLIHPQTESYWGNVNPIGIRSCYDEGKRISETYFFEYKRAFGVEIKVARIFNTYGPKMDPYDGRVVSNFIVQSINKEVLTIYGDGEQTRSFCYVDDLLDGLELLMNSNSDFSGPVNLGNPNEFKIIELVEKLEDYWGHKLEVTRLPLPKDDPKLRRPDISLARKELGFNPKILLDEGIGKTAAYFKEILS